MNLRSKELAKELAQKILNAIEPLATGPCEQPMAFCGMCEIKSLCEKVVGIYREAQGIVNRED